MEVHILTSTRDHVLAIWAAASYYAFSGRSDALVIHEYDRLSPRALAHIRRYFPHARIISRAEADAAVRHHLAHLPRLLWLRQQQPMVLKVTDVVLLGDAPRIILMDSDVLFFREPLELIRPSLRVHTFSRDLKSVYAVPDKHPANQFPLAPCVCTGVGNIDRSSVDFAHMERFLDSGVMDLEVVCHTPYIEQTLWALECGRAGFEYLPDTYTIRLAGDCPDAVAQHYVGPVRHLFFTEGLPRVARVLASQI
jgi:hypothetical protein